MMNLLQENDRSLKDRAVNIQNYWPKRYDKAGHLALRQAQEQFLGWTMEVLHS